MKFPVCKHAKRNAQVMDTWHWLASEPFRLFFFSGAVWSIIGVSLWPLFYAGKLSFFPNFCHARLMIEGFVAAFIVGFLGTAGPRMASAPKLTPLELFWLLSLHLVSGFCHLRLEHFWGDASFVVLLVSLLASLVIRILVFRKESPPPQLALAFGGLLCGIAGASLSLLPSTWADPQRFRLAGLLLYQGMPLMPVLGMGSFLFPRMLGGDFGVANSANSARRKSQLTWATVLLVLISFFVEVYANPVLGYLLRLAAASWFLLAEVKWRAADKTEPRGSLVTGLKWSLGCAISGLAFAGFFYIQHISIEHMLYIGGFGLLILIVASRVLFGHSGDLAGFSKRSGFVRLLVFLAVLTATTRMTPAFVPQVTVSHHIYAAWTWALIMFLWLVWHGRRFCTRDDDAS